MNEEYKYGSDNCYCMLTTGWETKSPIEIWKDIGLGHKEVIALTYDKFNAMMIIDAINESK
jgi:hypothetical protein